MTYNFIVYRNDENKNPILPACRLIKLKTWEGVRENIRRRPYINDDKTRCMSYTVEKYGSTHNILQSQVINLLWV